MTPKPSPPSTGPGTGAEIPFAAVVSDLDRLTMLYRAPHERAARKKIDHVDAGARAVIAASPFVLVATADSEGRCTVSPKGGRPGFVVVLDEHRLVIPDLAGNNLLDSMRNLLVNPHAGLLFVIPGRCETLRVEGRAWITTDEGVRRRAADPKGRLPATVIGVAVESTFIHCSASLNRAGVWEPSTWRPDAAPSAREVFEGHLAMNDPAR